ncbi:MAG: flagellar export chaperone FliS [Armatimonadota bacterium]|nr:flagellar export chaperone FliS [Armatimonadota bacterium]
MPVKDPWLQYQENQLNTVTPGRLLVMAFDAAIKFAHTAAEKMKAGKLDEQSANIAKVQSILLELISSLDVNQDKQLAGNLYGLYGYMFDRLTRANIRDDLAALEEVTGMLTEMRATWAEAEHLVRTGQAAGTERLAA